MKILFFYLFLLLSVESISVEKFEEFDCECIKWDQCSWSNDAFIRAKGLSRESEEYEQIKEKIRKHTCGESSQHMVYCCSSNQGSPDEIKALETVEVSCGQHKAGSCASCPQGNGASWCNGDCQWIDDQCVKKIPESEHLLKCQSTSQNGSELCWLVDKSQPASICWIQYDQFTSTSHQGCSPQFFGVGDITESEEYGCKEDDFGTISCNCNTNNCNTKLLVDNFIEEKHQSKGEDSEQTKLSQMAIQSELPSSNNGTYRPPTLQETGVDILNFKPGKDNLGCGVDDSSKRKLQAELVLGDETQPTDHPWLVGIIKTDTRKLHCGGSLIHPNWILTASHCFFEFGKLLDLEKTNLTAIFGTDDLGLVPDEKKYKLDEKRGKFEEQPILTYLVHEKYKPGVAYNDVALAFVTPVTPSSRIFPVCIPNVPIVFQDHLKNDAVDVLGYSLEVPYGYEDDFLWRLDENNKLINKNVSNWMYANEDFKFEFDGKDEKVHIIALGSNENDQERYLGFNKKQVKTGDKATLINQKKDKNKFEVKPVVNGTWNRFRHKTGLYLRVNSDSETLDAVADRILKLPPRIFSAKVHSKDVCNARHLSTGNYTGKISLALPKKFDQESIICVGNDQKEYGTCPGDSGGPMIRKNDENQWMQYGVLHGGIEDCRSDEYPSIFNLLTNPVNLKWIKKYAFNELIDDIFKNTDFEGVFRFAVINGSMDQIKKLLMIEDRINPIVGRDDRDTPYSLMHLAAREGQLEIVQYISNKLYEKNPSSLAVDYGRTPLHTAAQYGHLKVAKYIVNQIRKEKQRENPADAFGVTPAHLVAIYDPDNSTCCLTEDHNLYMLKGLVNNASVTNPAVIDDNKLGYLGATVEHCAAASGQIDIVEYYSGELTDIPKDSLNRTPLHYAVGGLTNPCLRSSECSTNFKVIKHYLQQYEDKSPIDSDGKAPLHYAVNFCSPGVIEMIIGYLNKSDINLPDNNLNTPLHYAAGSGSYDIVKFLAPKVPNINIRNNNGKTPLDLFDLAELRPDDDDKHAIVQQLYQYTSFPSNGNEIEKAVRAGDLAAVKELLSTSEHKNPVIYIDQDGVPWPLMHFAAFEGKWEILNYVSKSLEPGSSSCQSDYDCPMEQGCINGFCDYPECICGINKETCPCSPNYSCFGPGKKCFNSESQCLSLRVNLKNNAATSQGKKQGTFQLSSPVNGRLSWTSESQAIWYVPFYKEWAIGNLDDIGERFRGITSQGKESLGNSETYDPQDVLSWLYWNGDEWLSPDEKNDIILQCIEYLPCCPKKCRSPMMCYGMKSEIFGTQFDGFTPLHIATYQNDLELVQSILENNLDTTNYKNSAIVNSKFNNGLTPGDVAAKYRYVNVSKYLDADCPIWEDGYHFVLDKCYYQDGSLPWASYSYIKAQETCAEKFKNGGQLFEPKDAQTNNMVFKTINSYTYLLTGFPLSEMYLGIVADTYTDSDGILKVTGKHVYASSKTVIEYKSWHPNPPNLGGAHQPYCTTAYLSKEEDLVRWVSVSCTRTRMSICEEGKASMFVDPLSSINSAPGQDVFT